MNRYIDADTYAAELQKLRESYQILNDAKAIDKERLFKFHIMHGIFRAEQTLKKQPTVDAVPVVRCSKCRMSYIADESMEPYGAEIGKRYCASGRKVTDDFFCADGKRKDGEND